jgi:hypothetical protein
VVRASRAFTTLGRVGRVDALREAAGVACDLRAFAVAASAFVKPMLMRLTSAAGPIQKSVFLFTWVPLTPIVEMRRTVV